MPTNNSFLFSTFLFLQDETRKKAASTYLVENSDIPPPRYQKDGTLPMNYPNNTANSGMSINFWYFFSSIYWLHARARTLRQHTLAPSKWSVCVRSLALNIVISVRKNCDRTYFFRQRFIFSDRLHFYSIACCAFTYHISFVEQVIDDDCRNSNNNNDEYSIAFGSLPPTHFFPSLIRLWNTNETKWNRIA